MVRPILWVFLTQPILNKDLFRSSKPQNLGSKVLAPKTAQIPEGNGRTCPTYPSMRKNHCSNCERLNNSWGPYTLTFW